MVRYELKTPYRDGTTHGELRDIAVMRCIDNRTMGLILVRKSTANATR